MSIINKDSFQIFAEAAKTESFNTDNIFTSDVLADFEDTYKELRTISIDDIFYPAQSVPVMQVKKVTEGVQYCVEMDMLAKYMKSSGITNIKEALENVCEANEISIEECALVVESEDYARQVVEEAKGNKKKLKAVSDDSFLIKNMHNNSIKVRKKCSCKGKCKCSVREGADLPGNTASSGMASNPSTKNTLEPNTSVPKKPVTTPPAPAPKVKTPTVSTPKTESALDNIIFK